MSHSGHQVHVHEHWQASSKFAVCNETKTGRIMYELGLDHEYFSMLCFEMITGARGAMIGTHSVISV